MSLEPRTLGLSVHVICLFYFFLLAEQPIPSQGGGGTCLGLGLVYSLMIVFDLAIKRGLPVMACNQLRTVLKTDREKYWLNKRLYRQAFGSPDG
ncbi:hypothetical protein B0I35DRAFT_98588 [Stachybotrys elegans]|uniref:Uncharacterized protein n=1 Tax=Stachybotrys elegans TaxID=80388 RepID=A0A8K0SGE8_9HYPO|nr:hypothetical protein B0I35DRAFT_98588 [Stachybotrys elegans]